MFFVYITALLSTFSYESHHSPFKLILLLSVVIATPHIHNFVIFSSR